MEKFDFKFVEGYEEFEELSISKGCTEGILTIADVGRYYLNFYTPERLLQDARDEFSYRSYFREENLILVPDVSRITIMGAIEDIIQSVTFKHLQHLIEK